MSYIIQGSKDEFNLSTFEIGIIASFFPLGLLIGSIVWGVLSDKYGRCLICRVTGLTSTICSAGLATAYNSYLVTVFIFFLGIALGGEIALGSNIFCEFCPPSKRYFITMMSYFFSIGSVSVSGVALLVSIYNKTQFYEWRIIVAYGFLFEITSFGFRLILKETPAYYVGKGDVNRAEKILNEISMKNTGQEFKFVDIGDSKSWSFECEISSLINSDSDPEVKKKTNLVKDLCRKKLKVTVVLSIVLYIQIYFTTTYAYTGLNNFMPELLNNFSRSDAYTIMLAQQFCGIPGVLLGTYMVETKLGRKYTTCLTYTIGAICLFLFYFYKNFVYVNFNQVILVTSAMSLFIYLAYSALFTIAPESFPTKVRGIGSGILGIFSRTGGIITPIVTGYLLEKENGFQITIILFSSFYLVCGLLILLVKETRPIKKEKPKTLL